MIITLAEPFRDTTVCIQGNDIVKTISNLPYTELRNVYVWVKDVTELEKIEEGLYDLGFRQSGIIWVLHDFRCVVRTDLKYVKMKDSYPHCFITRASNVLFKDMEGYYKFINTGMAIEK